MHAQPNDDLRHTWKRIAQRLRAELGEDLYSSWFARMEPEELADDRLQVSVPTKFLKSWIESHYAGRLGDICEAELGKLDGVAIRVRSRGRPVAHRPAEEVRAGRPEAMPGQPVTAMREHASPLDPSLVFTTFVQGRSNLLAHAAALRVAEHQPGQPVSFNPLFIHSASGLGKTHLLNAIAWSIRERFAQRSVLFITAERFMYHFVAALKARDTLTFKDRFQGTDVLLIDDFQFLQGKTMQQEFCHTFNSLVDSRRQVIVAADVPPGQLESIDQRMRSRFAGGLVVDIEYPDLELRRAILIRRLAELQKRHPAAAQVPEDVVEYIANRITGGGRELEGALVRVMARQEVNRGPLTVDMAALALRDLAQNAELVRVRIDDILQVVGRHYNVSRADLLSPRRARSIVLPRQVGMYLAKKLTPRSLPEIGKRFGGRDHSTVLHAVRKIDELIKVDERVSREVALLARLIEQQ